MEVRVNISHYTSLLLFVVLSVLCACSEQKEHTADAINPEDSVSVMISYGINTLVSDSGVMKYRIVAEKWEVNEIKNPPRWFFPRGLFMEQFDEKFHVETYIQADTAYNYTQQKLWHLIGNVRVKTVDGLRFWSEELWWDQNRHELYSNLYSHVVTPEREIEGAYFTSDEHMRHYKVTSTKGNFIREEEKGPDNTATANDSTAPAKRSPAKPTLPTINR
ncbi:MAG: LPS export ABC transporter periplasmic protein LptC [Prevotella sp.]|nr:LPS export ABC transporter periplasmic protein LptC [Prevotella sp.]